MNRWRGKVAVVTGASSGIGLATAKALLNEGLIVVGLARRLEKMIDEMKDNPRRDQFHAKACDVTKESDVIEAFKYVEENFGALHVLINNAGTVTLKSVQQAEISELEHIINVNVFGVLYCSKHGIASMKKHGDVAHVVNINSIAGRKVPHPFWFGGGDIHCNVYSATKHAITAFSETLINELNNEGNKIRITNLSPGYTSTEIIPKKNSSEMTQGVKDLLATKQVSLSSEDVADSIVYVLSTPPHVQITELTIKPLGEKF
ncbi:hypothetical protein TKK_0007253 [Trichogramma kaykai]|uniref:Farnesol dehydrogenase n=1 Tax=Trichogramma kaykai TaxID=54128 RepID=A0ABD2XAV8_9HYME